MLQPLEDNPLLILVVSQTVLLCYLEPQIHWASEMVSVAVAAQVEFVLLSASSLMPVSFS